MYNQTHEAIQLLAQRILDMGHEEIPKPERQVIERVAKRLAVSRNINIEYDKSYTFGEWLADRVASFGDAGRHSGADHLDVAKPAGGQRPADGGP
jgi:hypothetical protein